MDHLLVRDQSGSSPPESIRSGVAPDNEKIQTS